MPATGVDHLKRSAVPALVALAVCAVLGLLYLLFSGVADMAAAGAGNRVSEGLGRSWSAVAAGTASLPEAMIASVSMICVCWLLVTFLSGRK